jgi:HSP20 family protein
MLGQALMSWQSPFSQLSTFRREMDELFSRFFGDWERAAMPGAGMGMESSPQLESYVHGNTLLFRLDLPGVDPKDVDLTVEGSQLLIKGERKPSAQYQAHAEGAQCLHSEVRYGRFARTMPLPATLATKKVPIAVEGEGRTPLK